MSKWGYNPTSIYSHLVLRWLRLGRGMVLPYNIYIVGESFVERDAISSYVDCGRRPRYEID